MVPKRVVSAKFIAKICKKDFEKDDVVEEWKPSKYHVV